MLDIKKVQEEAQQELVQERMEKAKKQVKSKLNEIATAEKVVANLKRELDDLYAELGQ
jgi:DNA anti-recombination protein RmuC